MLKSNSDGNESGSVLHHELNNPSRDGWPIYDKLGNRNRKPEATRACTTRVDVQNPVPLLDRRLVRMPRNDDPNADTVWFDIDLCNVMHNVNEQFANLNER